MRTQIPFAGTGVELCPASVSGTGRSAIGQYFNLSLVTVPGVFAKVTRRNNMAAVTSYKTYIARGKGFNTLGQLFERSLASVKQNPVLSHFQFAERFYENTIYCKTVS